jgi:hypothetical protein
MSSTKLTVPTSITANVISQETYPKKIAYTNAIGKLSSKVMEVCEDLLLGLSMILHHRQF